MVEVASRYSSCARCSEAGKLPLNPELCVDGESGCSVFGRHSRIWSMANILYRFPSRRSLSLSFRVLELLAAEGTCRRYPRSEWEDVRRCTTHAVPTWLGSSLFSLLLSWAGVLV